MAENQIAGTGLATDVSVEDGAAPTSKFALFTNHWLSLQSSTAIALKLPISQGDFEQKYGSFGSSKIITDSIAAMRDVQSAAKEFGDPKALRTQLIQNPDALNVDKAPDLIYTHTVWLGQRVSNNATTLMSGMKAVQSAFPGMSQADKVENIKKYLFNESMGPIPIAQRMMVDIKDLISKLLTFEKKMNEYNEKLLHYVKNTGALSKELEDKLGGIATQITTLTKARDDAHDSWLKFTIAAVAAAAACVAIGLLLAPVTMGASTMYGVGAAAIAGASLGAKAAAFMAEYNVYCTKLRDAETDQRKKQTLQLDLAGYNAQMGEVGPALSGFLQSLQGISGVWTGMNNNLHHMAETVTVKNIDALPFLAEGPFNVAFASWEKVDKAASDFTVSSLMNVEDHTPGVPLAKAG